MFQTFKISGTYFDISSDVFNAIVQDFQVPKKDSRFPAVEMLIKVPFIFISKQWQMSETLLLIINHRVKPIVILIVTYFAH